MAIVNAHIAAEPQAVFDVLAEGWYYSDWVVGSSHVRAVEAHWPETGARLFHATGVWPVVARDETVVEEVEPPHRLVLTAKGRPLGIARVTIQLTANSGGTDVTIDEVPVAGPGKWTHNRVTDLVLARRNIETLARLKALVERQTRPE